MRKKEQTAVSVSACYCSNEGRAIEGAGKISVEPFPAPSLDERACRPSYVSSQSPVGTDLKLLLHFLAKARYILLRKPRKDGQNNLTDWVLEAIENVWQTFGLCEGLSSALQSDASGNDRTGETPDGSVRISRSSKDVR